MPFSAFSPGAPCSASKQIDQGAFPRGNTADGIAYGDGFSPPSDSLLLKTRLWLEYVVPTSVQKEVEPAEDFEEVTR